MYRGRDITLWMIWKDEQYNILVIGYTTTINWLWTSKYFKQIMIRYKIMRLKPLSERPRKLSFLSPMYWRINFISLPTVQLCPRENEDYLLLSRAQQGTNVRSLLQLGSPHPPPQPPTLLVSSQPLTLSPLAPLLCTLEGIFVNSHSPLTSWAAEYLKQ